MIDTRLEQESTHILSLECCQVRLHHNAAFPWILLIPEQENVQEIFQLTQAHQILLINEIVLASNVMHTLFTPTKLNVANLGNIVSQLHIHIIARYTADLAWPGPIWNSGVNQDYSEQSKSDRIIAIKEAFLTLKPALQANQDCNSQKRRVQS